MAKKELILLQETMKKANIDWYLIPTDDDHQSEYVGDYYKGRRWVSGFTGSAGVLVSGQKEAYLFTDGRYYVQAAKELEGSGIALMKSGTEGVPTPEEFLIQQCEKGMTAAFDKRVVAKDRADIMMKGLSEKGAFVKDMALLDEIWEDRPARSATKVFELKMAYAGESLKDKLSRLREKMQEKGTQGHVIATLDEIAWLFNLRGNDVECSPMFLSFAYVTMEDAYLFVQKGVLLPETEVYLAENDVYVKEYDTIYDFLKERKEANVLIDPERTNARLHESFGAEVTLVQDENPMQLMKAIKNEVEIANSVVCHIKDSVNVTRLMRHVKTNCQNPDWKMDEWEAGEYVTELRRQTEGCVDSSFAPISAYGANGAMMHYSAKKDGCARLVPGNFYLIDSGAQFHEGTTDITRTFVLGEVNAEAKKHFTAVARGMLTLQNAKFLKGCKGVNLDILARQPMWEMGIDYRCGTGHGLGFYLNVHEGPNSFRWKSGPGYHDCELEPGMITTDEPGIYIENQYGIRLENDLLCVADEENEYGQFLKFEPLTYVPIDLDGIDPTCMTVKEKEVLNAYHQKVFEVISPFMNEEEKDWLKEYTRPID